jgi:hypothetical protein
LLGLAALAGSPATLGDESDNLRQLLAMPRERRIALSDNLERFDKLDPAERDAIRKLDAEIARSNPVEQARYRSLLRRYHLWVNGLTEEQRDKLKAAGGPEARYNLASNFRLKEKGTGSASPSVSGIRTGSFGIMGPHEVAYLLRIWKLITPLRKSEIEKEEPRKRIQSILAQHREKGVANQPFPEAEEKHYHAQIVGDPTLKRLLPSPPLAKKAAPKPDERRLAEFLYFEEHKPKAVLQANLERFSASCPNWLLEMLDPLSPDDARAYLTIVYRLLYPEPGEIPADVKPAKTATPPKPGAEKPTKKSGPAGPF